MPGAYRAAVTIRDGTAGEWALDWASSGAAALTGRPDGPPLLPPGNAATAARKLADDLRTATGGRVDVDGPALLAERAAFTGHRRAGARSVGGSCRLLPTADGWAAVSCARPDDPLLLGALVERELPGRPVAGARRLATGAQRVRAGRTGRAARRRRHPGGTSRAASAVADPPAAAGRGPARRGLQRAVGGPAVRPPPRPRGRTGGQGRDAGPPGRGPFRPPRLLRPAARRATAPSSSTPPIRTAAVRWRRWSRRPTS